VVKVFDVRPVVKEQVESLGAEFIDLEVTADKAEDTGGYAKAQSDEAHQKEQEVIGKHVKESDIVITTALIPGKPAPVLITEEMVKQMKAGAVIVDLAVEQGGNCEISEVGAFGNLILTIQLLLGLAVDVQEKIRHVIGIHKTGGNRQ